MGKGQFCAAQHCFSQKSRIPDLNFFNFPRNDVERLLIWVKNSGRKELVDKVHENPLKTRYYHLCAKHFDDSQFMNVEKRNSLIKGAVPTIFFDKHNRRITDKILGLDFIETFKNPVKPESSETFNTQKILDLMKLTQSSNAICLAMPDLNNKARCVQNQIKSMEQFKNQNICIKVPVQPSIPKNDAKKPNINIVVLSKDSNQLKENVNNANTIIYNMNLNNTFPGEHNLKQELTEKEKRQRRTINCQRVKIYRLKKTVQRLKDKLMEQKQIMKIDSIVGKATEHLEGFSKELVEYQLRMSHRKNVGRRYPENIKQWSLDFFRKYPAAYGELNKDLGLPHKRTISNWLAGIEEPLPENLMETEGNIDDDDDDLISDFDDEDIRKALGNDEESLSDLRDSDSDCNLEEGGSKTTFQTYNHPNPNNDSITQIDNPPENQITITK